MIRQYVLLPAIALLLALFNEAVQADVGQLQLTDDVPTVWLRRVVTLDTAADGKLNTFRVAGNAVVSVYVNAQQLCRNERVPAGGVIQFDVSDLVRNGRNGLAVAARRAGDNLSAAVSVWVNHHDKAEQAATGKG